MKSSYIWLLGRYLSPQKFKAVLLFLLLLITMALQIANPQIIRYFIDTATDGGNTSTLIQAAAIFIGFVIMSQLSYASANYLGEDVGWTATNWLRIDLAKHCLNLDMTFFKEHTAGEMIERIEGDVNALANFLSKSAAIVLINFLLLLGILVLITLEDWRVGLFAILFTLLSAITLHRVRGVAVPYALSLRKTAADLSGFTEEKLSGIEDITANGSTPYILHQLIHLLRELLHHFRLAHVLSRVFSGTMEVGLAVAAAMVLTIGAYLYRGGEMSLGTIYMTFYYTQLLGASLQTVVRQFTDIQIAAASIQRINELFNTHSHIEENPVNTIPEGSINITFDAVEFGYDNDQTVFPNLSFTLKAGQALGLLGRTGSGKTSLTRLLFRLYDPRQGSIMFNGIDIRTVALQSLRQRIGLVTQDVQLLRGTIRDNLAFYDATIEDAAIEQALDEIGLTAWVDALPQGLDTEILPQSLSAGEAQLLALTRVFLHKPDIIVLDEASSRLDPVTERLLDNALQMLLSDRTAIIIAHRLETIHKVDQVMILEKGQINEWGARSALVADLQSRLSHLLKIGTMENLV